jgi:hypothetical protein
MRSLAASLLLLAWSSGSPAAESKVPCQDVSDPGGLSTLCGFAKPEDVQFIPSKGVVIVSEQGWKAPKEGGAISVVEVAIRPAQLGKRRALWPSSSTTRPVKLRGDPECITPPTAVFSPHGLSVLDRPSGTRLAIINHAGREAVELFDLKGAGDALQLEWRGCVMLPPDTAGNDVTLHSDGRMFVTNYCPSVHDARAVTSISAGLRGELTGDVMEWSPSKGWRRLPGTAMAFPNGIVLDEPRRRLYVSELGKSKVVEFALEPGGAIDRRGEFAFQDMADNLDRTGRGILLVAGPSRKNSRQWSVAEINPLTGKVRSLFEGETAIHSVTSATDIGGGIVFGSTSDERIAVARWPAGKPGP